MTHPHYEPKDERSFSVSPFSSLYKSFKINNSFEEHILDSELKITCRKIAQSQYVQHNVNMTIPFLIISSCSTSSYTEGRAAEIPAQPAELCERAVVARGEWHSV